jgi:hypothetical protein
MHASKDRLPILTNVLRGEMSIIGPRGRIARASLSRCCKAQARSLPIVPLTSVVLAAAFSNTCALPSRLGQSELRCVRPLRWGFPPDAAVSLPFVPPGVVLVHDANALPQHRKRCFQATPLSGRAAG